MVLKEFNAQQSLLLEVYQKTEPTIDFNGDLKHVGVG